MHNPTRPWRIEPWTRLAAALVAAMRHAEAQDLWQHELVRRAAFVLWEGWHGLRVTARHPQPWREWFWMTLAQVGLDALCQAETDGHDAAGRVAFALWGEVNSRLGVGDPAHAHSR